MTYRGWDIYYERKPYVGGFDWSYAHKDYDGAEDGRCGHAASLEAAKAEIDEREDD